MKSEKDFKVRREHSSPLFSVLVKVSGAKNVLKSCKEFKSCMQYHNIHNNVNSSSGTFTLLLFVPICFLP